MQKKNKLNILFLTFWSPPAVRPRAIAIGKLMPEFIKQGLSPVIITYESNGHWEINAPVYKIPQFRIIPVLNLLRLSVISKYLYYKKICRLAEKLIRQYDIKVIFSFSNPQDSNIIGAILKKKIGIPFISYFSDPWYDNSYKKFSKLAGWKVLHLERFIIKNSDRVVFINEAERDLIMKKYPQDWGKKTRIGRHCYNPADYPEISKDNEEKFIFSHVGVFYKQRNPEIFLQAVAKVIKDVPALRAKIKIKFIGGTVEYGGYSEKSLSAVINKYGLKEIVEILPQVEHNKSLGCMKLADCLIVIDADVNGSICSPSKLFEYAGSGTAIIGITPAGSPTENFLSNLGCQSFTYQQTDQLADYIKKIVNKELKITINKDFLEKFNVKNIAREYINIFFEAVEEIK